MVDGVVLVVKAESDAVRPGQRAVEAIGRERMLGIVLNRAKEQPNSDELRLLQVLLTASPAVSRRQR